MSKQMDKRKEFDNILDECLERVMKGEDLMTVLTRYPAYADELEPLLKTAMSARAAASIRPRPEFRQRAALEFQQAIREMPVKSDRGGFRWQAAWMTPLAVFIALVIAGSGTVAAASNSLPDSPLYPVKLAAESVQMALTPSSLGKAELYARFNDKRVDEIVRMAEEGKAGQIEKLTASMASNMAAIDELTGGSAKMVTFSISTSGAPEAAYSVPQTTVAGTVAAPTVTQPPLTRAPMTTAPPQTMVPAATSPAPMDTVTVTIPPATSGVAPDESHGNSRQDAAPQLETSGRGKDIHGNGDGAGRTDEEKLQELLTNKQQEALRKLYRELENASDELKPRIQAAIDVILEGYNISISNLAE